jgi:HK97 family phage portal protein
MQFTDILNRVLPPLPPAPEFNQIKSSTYPSSFAAFLRGSDAQDLAAIECIRLYKKCLPFFDAVSRRAEAFSSIPIRCKDKNTHLFVESKALALLNKPNQSQGAQAFKKALSSYMDICGEAFLIITLSTKGEPLEIYAISPQDVTVEVTKRGTLIPIAESFLVSNTVITESFHLDKMTYRYRNRNNNLELWHVKEFNPQLNSDNVRGLPKAAPLWLQIQQFIEADTNNYSILKRGGRPSLAWIWEHDEPMTDDQFTRWQEQVLAYEGAINAGRQVLLDNMRLEEVGLTNKDMEFSVNRQTVKNDIYSAYSIPLPLVSAQSMTMDNLKVSAVLLYEQSVLPHTDNLLDELTRFLIPLFKEPESYVLTYNAVEIQPLKERMIDEASKIGIMGIATDNELRDKVGYEKIDGGDVIYKNMSLIPVGGDYGGDSFEDEDDELSGDDDETLDEKRQRYARYLMSVKKITGERVFSDEYIASAVKRRYGND